jgi:predicted Zn-dependent peptidase
MIAFLLAATAGAPIARAPAGSPSVVTRYISGVKLIVALVWLGACAVSPRPVQPSGNAGVSATGHEAGRGHPPPEQAYGFGLPEPYAARLSNGMQLVVLERHTPRQVAIDLVVRGGTASLPQGSPAIARLMTETMPMSTQRSGVVEILQALNQNAIQLSPHIADTWLGFKMRAGSPQLDAALRILSEIALEPTFPTVSVNAMRQVLIPQLESSEQPAAAARRNLFAALYGLDHPYTVALAPQAHDLEAVSRDDVADLRRAVMDPARTILVVAGDVDPLVVREAVATLFGEWARDPTVRDPLPVAVPPAVSGPTRIIAVDRPGAQQATIFYGGRLPTGDSIASRAARVLIQDLVEQGQTRANASGSHDPTANWKAAGHFPVGILWWETQVAPAQAPIAVHQMDGWLCQLRERGPDAKELQAARNRAILHHPALFATIEYIAAAYAELVAVGLPLDSINKLQASLVTLPWDQIRPALPPADQMRLVVVGDLKVVTPSCCPWDGGPSRFTTRTADCCVRCCVSTISRLLDRRTSDDAAWRSAKMAATRSAIPRLAVATASTST